MIISLQESRDSCAGLPVPGHANDAMTVSMNLILINTNYSEGEQNRVNVFKNNNLHKCFMHLDV